MKYNKEFEYKGYKFNTSVELNAIIEKRIDGKRFHRIITNCMGGNNYYVKDEIESYQIGEYVIKHQNAVVKYIDKLIQMEETEEEKILINMGFSK